MKSKLKLLAAPYSNEHVHAEIMRLASILSRGFAFGYYTDEDIAQEAYIDALEGLPNYDNGGLDSNGDAKRPLDKFLFTHIKFKLLNLKRDEFRRSDPPCVSCHLDDFSVHMHDGYCRKYAEWRSRNDAKSGLMAPLGLTDLEAANRPGQNESDALDAVSRAEIVAKLDAIIPASLRASYLKMKSGETIKRSHREAIKKLIAENFSDAEDS